MEIKFACKLLARIKSLFVPCGIAKIGTSTPIYDAEEFIAFYRRREAILTRQPCEVPASAVAIIDVYDYVKNKMVGTCFSIQHASGYVFCPIGGTQILYADRHDILMRPATQFALILQQHHLLVEGRINNNHLIVIKATFIDDEKKAINFPCYLGKLVAQLH